MVTAALDAGFIINSPGPRTIRLAPPLILTTEQADRFLAALPGIIRAGAAQTTPPQPAAPLNAKDAQ